MKHPHEPQPTRPTAVPSRIGVNRNADAAKRAQAMGCLRIAQRHPLS